MVSRAKTELWHRLLTHYLPLYFPEVERFQGNSRSDWFLALLERFPTPASITALSKEAFVEAAWDVVGRKVSKARLLADIYETARSSTALPVRPDSPAIAMFRMVLAEGRSLIRQRDQHRSPGRGCCWPSDAGLPAATPDARHRADHRADHSGRGRRSSAFRPSSSVPEVLRVRPCDTSVRHIPRPDQAVQVRQRSPAPNLLAGGPGRDPPARQLIPANAMADMLPRIPRTSISGARRSPRSPPRWRASLMRSSAPEQTTGRSWSGRCQVEGLRSVSAVRARVTPLPCR